MVIAPTVEMERVAWEKPKEIAPKTVQWTPIVETVHVTPTKARILVRAIAARPPNAVTESVKALKYLLAPTIAPQKAVVLEKSKIAIRVVLHRKSSVTGLVIGN